MRVTKRFANSESVLDSKAKVMHELIGRSAALGGTTNHSIFYVVIPVGQSFPIHYHKLSEETYYILRGTATVEVENQRLSLEAGEAVLVMPGEVHGIACDGDEEVEFLAVTAPPFHPDDVYLVE